jgi:hypothetical protein
MLINLLTNIPPIDLFSFVLGIVLGIVFYIVLIRLRNIYSHVHMTGKKKIEKKSFSSSHKITYQYLFGLLRRSQSDHLLGAIFPLNDVDVPVNLIYPYPYIDPKKKVNDSFEASNLLPFVPEFSEFYESIPYRTSSLFSAIQNHNLILLQGNIGSGKTTLINHAVSSLIENNEEAAQFAGFTPFYCHYSEIDLKSKDEQEPVQLLFDSVLFHGLNLTKSSLISSFLPIFTSGKAILFIDGLDETIPNLVSEYSLWIKDLISAFPSIKIVVSGNLSFSDDFQSLGFTSYFLSPLTTGIRKEINVKLSQLKTKFSSLFDHFSMPFSFDTKLWNRQIKPFENIPLSILYLLSENSLSGSVQSASSVISNYINRFCPNVTHLAQLVKVAKKTFENPLHILKKEELTSILGNNLQIELQMISVSFFDYLISMGLLIERQPGYFGFQSNYVLAFLQGQEINSPAISSWESYYYDPIKNLGLAFSKEQNYIEKWLIQKEVPLYKNLECLKPHFDKIRNDQEFQNKEITIILSALQSEDISFPIKLKYLGLLINFENETLSKALDFLYQKNQKCKLFSILGYGFIFSNKSLRFLKNVLNMGSPLEKAFGAISLNRIDDEEARQILLSSLQSGDDLYRRLVCEMLSIDYIEGQSILKTLSTDKNIAIRKSSIFGIKIIPAPWVVDFLTSMSTKDSEWLVRDAAAAALEEITTHQIELSNTVPEHPAKLEWLLSLASQRGQGISAKSIPNDLLFDLINNGQAAEKLASLYILSRYPNKEISDLFTNLYESETELSDQSFFYASEISRHESYS